MAKLEQACRIARMSETNDRQWIPIRRAHSSDQFGSLTFSESVSVDCRNGTKMGSPYCKFTELNVTCRRFARLSVTSRHGAAAPKLAFTSPWGCTFKAVLRLESAERNCLNDLASRPDTPTGEPSVPLFYKPIRRLGRFRRQIRNGLSRAQRRCPSMRVSINTVSGLSWNHRS